MQKNVLPSFLDVAHGRSLKPNGLGKPFLGQSALLAFGPDVLANLFVKPIEIIHDLHESHCKRIRANVNNNDMLLLMTKMLSLQHGTFVLCLGRIYPLCLEEQYGQRKESLHNGLDRRCRDDDGEIRQKRGDTLVERSERPTGRILRRACAATCGSTPCASALAESRSRRW